MKSCSVNAAKSLDLNFKQLESQTKMTCSRPGWLETWFGLWLWTTRLDFSSTFSGSLVLNLPSATRAVKKRFLTWTWNAVWCIFRELCSEQVSCSCECVRLDDWPPARWIWASYWSTENDSTPVNCITHFSLPAKFQHQLSPQSKVQRGGHKLLNLLPVSLSLGSLTVSHCCHSWQSSDWTETIQVVLWLTWQRRGNRCVSYSCALDWWWGDEWGDEKKCWLIPEADSKDHSHCFTNLLTSILLSLLRVC